LDLDKGEHCERFAAVWCIGSTAAEIAVKPWLASSLTYSTAFTISSWGRQGSDLLLSRSPYHHTLSHFANPIAEATRVGFFPAVALHKNVRNFLRAGRKGCTKMKSQSINLMGIEFAWLYPGCGKFLQVWNKNF